MYWIFFLILANRLARQYNALRGYTNYTCFFEPLHRDVITQKGKSLGGKDATFWEASPRNLTPSV